MWFKSGKNFKENAEDKIILFVTTQFAMHSFEGETYENHQNRGLFVDELLNEPNMEIIRINPDKEVLETETLKQIMENVGRHD